MLLKNRSVIFVLFSLFMCQILFAQVQVSGQLDVVIRNTNAKDFSNKTFAGFSNYDFLRARLFFDSQPSENVTVFTQIFISENRFNLYAAYLRLSFFEQQLNVHLGLIPNTVGIWGPRTYADKNPFIGIPLMHNYHSTFDFKSINNDVTNFVAGKGLGYDFGGLPILYDFCWNAGIEFFGSYGIVDWSVAAITGSETHPTRSQEKALPQITSRLIFILLPEFSFSFSGYWGPYLSKEHVKNLVNISKSENDFINKGFGLGLVYSKGYFELFSETFWASWDHPYFNELSAWSSYIDLKYKFAIQWYAATRFELMRFSKLNYENYNDSWDYPLNRYTFVLGYHWDRNVVFKLDTQFTDNLGNNGFDDNIIAFQVSTSF
jgi:hypothetical protein